MLHCVAGHLNYLLHTTPYPRLEPSTISAAETSHLKGLYLIRIVFVKGHSATPYPLQDDKRSVRTTVNDKLT